MRTFLCAMALLAVATPAASQQDPVYRIDGLVVTGAPQPRALSSMGAHVTVLDGDDLRARGVWRVSDALGEVPGLAVVEGGSFGSVASLFLRGAESDFVQVLIDGVQVNEPGGSFDFSGLDTEGIERIEVLRGPASALYGSDAAGGVVHIITRGGTGSPSGSISAGGGAFGRREWSAGLEGGGARISYGFSLTDVRSDGILEFNNEHENRVLGGVVRFAPDDRSRIELATRIGSRAFHYPTDGSGNVVDRNAFTWGDDIVLGLDAGRRLHDRVDVELSLSSYESDTGTNDAPDGPADTLGFYGYTSLASLRRTEARAETHLTLNGSTTGTVGAEISSQAQRSFNEALSAFGPSSGQSSNERWNRAAFVHLVSAVGAVALNAGGRLEHNERFGRAGTWQLGVSVPWSESGRVRGAAGTGIKEPTFYENYATGFVRGNPELDPERSTSWELGVEQALLSDAVRLSATWFDQTFDDLIQYTSTPVAAGDPNYFNVAEASSAGAEVGLTVRFAGLTIAADGTWLETEVLNSGFDSGAGAAFVEGERLLRRPTVTVGGSVGYRAGSLGTVTASIRRVGDRDDRDFSTFPTSPVELPAYTLLDAGGEVRLFDGRGPLSEVILTLRAENLLDERYEQAFGFRAPGRGVYLGARVSLGGR